MHRLGLMCVLVGILVASAGATAAVRVSVTPLEGKPRTKFTVSFKVDRKLTGDRWFVVSVVSPVRRRDCEYEESAVVSYVPAGRRVNVLLRPVDKFRWCPGTYGGEIQVHRRTGCGEPGIDQGACSTSGRPAARFSFAVRP
mgnify:CR=1 FL=1